MDNNSNLLNFSSAIEFIDKGRFNMIVSVDVVWLVCPRIDEHLSMSKRG